MSSTLELTARTQLALNITRPDGTRRTYMYGVGKLKGDNSWQPLDLSRLWKSLVWIGKTSDGSEQQVHTHTTSLDSDVICTLSFCRLAWAQLWLSVLCALPSILLCQMAELSLAIMISAVGCSQQSWRRISIVVDVKHSMVMLLLVALMLHDAWCGYKVNLSKSFCCSITNCIWPNFFPFPQYK